MFIQQDLASLRAGNVSLFDVLYLIETLFTANVKASLHYEFGEDLLYLAKVYVSAKKKKKCRSFLSEWMKFFRLDSSHHIVFHVNLISSTETPLTLTAQVLCGSPLNQKPKSNTVVWTGFRSHCRMLFYFLKTAFLA